jgi:hypothetical protein
VCRWLQTLSGSSLADFSTLKVEATRSSETSVHTRSTRRHIPEDGILHSHRYENFKSYSVILYIKHRVQFEAEIYLHILLSSGLDEWFVSSSGLITPGKTRLIPIG